MAQPDEPTPVKASTLLYPDPPPFWESFTPEKAARIEALRQAHASEHAIADVTSVVRVPNVPEDLQHLQPPAEPADGKWRVFGEELTLRDQLQSLEEAGIERLPPAGEVDRDGKHMDRGIELKRLAKSLILNFLELVGTVSMDPSKALVKLQDLRTLFFNFHHLLNEYRPHQAREQLIQLMQDRLDATRAETAAIRDVTEKAKRSLEALGSIEVPDLHEAGAGAGAGAGGGEGEGKGKETETSFEEQKRADWAELDEECA